MGLPKMPKKMNTVEFVEKAIKKHGDKYNYQNVQYVNSGIEIEIICPKHGPFKQKPHYHLCGNGCKLCAWHNFANIRKKPLDKIIQQFREKHGDKYDYSQVDHINNDTDITIICPNHGPFKQKPNTHGRGSGCYLCVNSSYLKSDFIENSNQIHSNKYDYSKIKSEYILTTDYITIICPHHGPFKQQRRQHTIGRGCPHPSCCRCPQSNMEIKWIESLEIPTILYPHRLVDLKMQVDGYDPTTNTVFEFYGDFWHGNPKVFNQERIHPLIKSSFKDIYKKTLKREDKILNAGYKLVTIWENDWNSQNGVKTNIRL
jgi:hypothetical protein